MAFPGTAKYDEGYEGKEEAVSSTPQAVLGSGSIDKPAGEEDDQAYYHWSKRNGVFRPVGHTQDEVPAGIYEIDNDNGGWFLSRVKFPSDNLLRLPGMPIDYILNQIDTFWKREELFKQTGLLHKRGILMYGPAGCGKTSIIRLLCDDVVNKRNGIVIMVTNCRLAETALGGIRQIEPRRPILTIIEDIETFMGQSDESSSARALLALLDGETQVDHIVHLATTNKPDQLEDRIVKRPGRFDLVVGLNHPVADARRAYLENLLHDHVTATEMDEMVDETEGLGLAHLRELVVANYCLGLDRKETLARLRHGFKEKLKIKKGASDNMGFTTSFPEKDGKIGLK
jgi:ATPase family associated with various cellular activities (AAA)